MSCSHNSHDQVLARLHSERSNRVRVNTPKLMSSLAYEFAARSTDSDVADDASVQPFHDRSA